MVRLLLVAPTVDGTDVGESWVASQWARRLSERHQVTLLTYRKRGGPSASAQVPKARVIEWVEPPLLGRSERFNSLVKPGYVPFYVRARRWIRRAVGDGEVFDVAHQPVPVAMRYPTPLHGLGIPYVLGPVGGSLSSPPGFDSEDTAPWYVGLRRVDSWRLRHDPALRRSYEGASCVLAIAPYAQATLGGLRIRRLQFMSETGLSELPASSGRPAGGDTVRLLFVGRVVRTKGVRDAVRALALVADLPVSFDVVGDGFDRPACEQLASDLGLNDRITFHGFRAKAEVEAYYAAADIFLFPSYREPGGNAVFEAMGHGLPMIVCDRGGPGQVVDESCGIRVPAQSPEDYCRRLAQAVRDLVENPSRREAMGRAARESVSRSGLWEHRIQAAERIYQEIAREQR